ncbi:MAG: sulfatase [Planctomycetota bacterium]|jgi:arylsulfatase A-like enzyme
MSSNRCSRTALLPAALLALAACSPDEAPEPEAKGPKNVVLFVCDTLRSDRLGCYGYFRDTSPRIDAWADGGTLYERNYSQGCWTVPSMISMFSGKYVFAEEEVLPNTPTLSEVLNDGGVFNAAFVCNDVLVRARGFRRGFHEFHRPPQGGRRATKLVEYFKEWWGEHEEDIGLAEQRFFWLHAFDPHAPFEPDPALRPDDWEIGDDKRFYYTRTADSVEEAKSNALPDSWDFNRAVTKMSKDSMAYDGEVLGVDIGFGMLLDFLEEKGELDDTLILFAADHGEKLYEHPLYPQEKNFKLEANGGYPQGVADIRTYSHRAFFRDELWNTPLIMAGPGVPSGQRVDSLSSNLDLYPTICAAFGLEAPEDLRGRNLLAADPGEWERVHAYGFGTIASIEPEGTKFISHHPSRYLLRDDQPRPVELLHVFEDPDELELFNERRPQEVERMNRVVSDWNASVQRPYSMDIPDEEFEALKNLGYMDYAQIEDRLKQAATDGEGDADQDPNSAVPSDDGSGE